MRDKCGYERKASSPFGFVASGGRTAEPDGMAADYDELSGHYCHVLGKMRLWCWPTAKEDANVVGVVKHGKVRVDSVPDEVEAL